MKIKKLGFLKRSIVTLLSASMVLTSVPALGAEVQDTVEVQEENSSVAEVSQDSAAVQEETSEVTGKYEEVNSNNDTPDDASDDYVAHILEFAEADVKKAGSIADGEQVPLDPSGYFTLNGGSKVEIRKWNNEKNPTYPDGYSPTHEITFGGTVAKGSKSIYFKVTRPSTVYVWWYGGGAGRQIALSQGDGCDAAPALGSAIAQSADITADSTTLYKSKMLITDVPDGGQEYVLWCANGQCPIAKVEVDEGLVLKHKAAWDTVSAPEITEIKQTVLKATAGSNEDDDKPAQIAVTVKGVVGSGGKDVFDGADYVEVTMTDSDGNESTAKADNPTNSTSTVYFTPAKTGTYTFKAALIREEKEETDDFPPKTTEEKSFDFNYLLNKPVILGVTNIGNSKAKVTWSDVKEAEFYALFFNVNEIMVTPKTTYEIDTSAFPEKSKQKIQIYAIKGVPSEGFNKTVLGQVTKDHRASRAGSKEFEVLHDTVQTEWLYARMGTSTNKDKCGGEDMTPDELEMSKKKFHVYSVGGAGKIVPATVNNDGIAFFYTPVKKGTNYTFSAHVHVNDWFMSNGQDGFGIVATDRIVPNTEYVLNNSIMAAATKVLYRWDGTAETTDTSIKGCEMKLGLSALGRFGDYRTGFDPNEKEIAKGITKTDKIESEFAGDSSGFIINHCTVDQSSLEHSTATRLGGTFNIVGNATDANHTYDKDKSGAYRDDGISDYPKMDMSKLFSVDHPLTEFDFTIDKNKNGYCVTYTDQYGRSASKWYYKEDMSEDHFWLNQFDEDYEYVGMFAARNADCTFTNVNLKTYDEKTDDRTFDIENTVYKLNASFVSASTTNNEDYDLTFLMNWAGNLTVRDEAGNVVVTKTVSAADVDKYIHIPASVKLGSNRFSATFKPDTNYHYNEKSWNILADYAAVDVQQMVNFRNYGGEGDTIYVSNTGKSSNKGTMSSPLDIYTAVKYAMPGQTIVIKGGYYSLTQGVVIQRGTNGTKDKPIYLIADPELSQEERPVFDFNNAKTAGITIAGDYWYLKGIDVTKSGNGYKGVSISGSYNVVDLVNSYRNGNNGFAIERLKGTDESDMWPHDNLILNCTSYDNADLGYEDADGFAAKLTVGEGNVFDGCMAFFNADDGWDLYAKGESGAIGEVTIRNCVAYGNGWVHDRDGADKDGDGLVDLVNAGNGNGFKMGGENIPVAHKIYNSFSFMNKANGVESNSDPYNQVYNTLSFENGGNNFALYTSYVKDSRYKAQNVLSLRANNGFSIANVTFDNSLLSKSERFKPSGLQTKSVVAESIWRDAGYTSADDVPLKTWYENSSTYYWTPAKKGGYTTEIDPATGKTIKKNVQIKDIKSVSFDCAREFIPRNADGSIKMGYVIDANGNEVNRGFLMFTDAALARPEIKDITENIKMNNTASKSFDAKALAEKETKGSVSKGGDDIDTSNEKTVPRGCTKPEVFTVQGGTRIAITYPDKNYWKYTGKEVKPDIQIWTLDKLGQPLKRLNESVKGGEGDYKIRYRDCTEATGKPHMYIIGTKSFIGTFVFDYVINPVSFAVDEVVHKKPDYDGYSGDYIDYVKPINVPVAINELADGKVHKPVPEIYYFGKKLSIGKEFNLKYYDKDGKEIDSMTEKGEYTISVNGVGNYTGSRNIKYKLVDSSECKNLKDVTIPKIDKVLLAKSISGNRPYSNDELAKNPENSLKDGDKVLVEDVDYTVMYIKNTKKGVARAVINGIGQYYGTMKVKFRILPIKLKKANTTVSGLNATVRYNGTAVNLTNPSYFPAFDVMFDGKELEADYDYKVLPKNGVKRAGNVVFKIVGKNAYSGAIRVKVNIEAAELNESMVSYNKASTVSYNTTGNIPEMSVAISSNKLRQGVDYAVKTSSVKNCGPASVEIKGRGAVKGTLSKIEYTIVERSLSDDAVFVTVNDITIKPDKNGGKGVAKTDAVIYERAPVKDPVKGTVTYKFNTFGPENYEVTAIKNEAGEDIMNQTIGSEYVGKDVYVTVTGKKNMTGSKVVKVHCGYPFANAAIDDIVRNYQYGEDVLIGETESERARAFEGKVKYKNSATRETEVLTYGTDFTLNYGPGGVNFPDYSNNIKAGKAVVKLKGIGKFAGIKECNFKILNNVISSLQTVETN